MSEKSSLTHDGQGKEKNLNLAVVLPALFGFLGVLYADIRYGLYLGVAFLGCFVLAFIGLICIGVTATELGAVLLIASCVLYVVYRFICICVSVNSAYRKNKMCTQHNSPQDDAKTNSTNKPEESPVNISEKSSLTHDGQGKEKNLNLAVVLPALFGFLGVLYADIRYGLYLGVAFLGCFVLAFIGLICIGVTATELGTVLLIASCVLYVVYRFICICVSVNSACRKNEMCTQHESQSQLDVKTSSTNKPEESPVNIPEKSSANIPEKNPTNMVEQSPVNIVEKLDEEPNTMKEAIGENYQVMKKTYFEMYFDSWKKGKLFWCIVVAVIIGFITGTIQRFPENPLYVIGALLGCTIIIYLFAALLVGFIYAKIRCAIDKNKYTIVPRYSEEEFEKYFIQKFISEIKPNIIPDELERVKITNEMCKLHTKNELSKSYCHSTYKVNDSWVVIEQSGTYLKSSYSLIPTLNGNLRDDVATLVNHFKNTSDSERRKVLDADWKNICFGFVVTYKGVYFTIYLYNKDELENKLAEKTSAK